MNGKRDNKEITTVTVWDQKNQKVPVLPALEHHLTKKQGEQTVRVQESEKMKEYESTVLVC